MEDIDMADVRLTQLFTNIANAIRNKKGSDGIIKAADFPAEIESIEVGGGEVVEVERKDVNFYDYEGTLLFSYTLAEVQALTELPTPKGHEGLVFQGWNWDYEDVIALDYPMDIGAMYITDDGKTRLYINVRTKVAMDVPLYFSQSIDRGVTIDWGDGSPTETIEGTGSLSATHHYNDVGKYCISLDVAEDCSLILGGSQSNESVLGLVQNNNPLTYATYLDKVELGQRVSFATYAFKYSPLRTISFTKDIQFTSGAFHSVLSLEALVIPQSSVSNGNGANQAANAYFLKCVLLPKITNSSGAIVNNCRNLKYIRLAESIKILPVNSLRGCYSISEILMPSSLTTLGGYALGEMHSLRLLDYRRCKQIPTNQGNNSIPSEAIVVVPDALYDEWIIATNWSAIASQIMKASEYESIYG